MKLNLFEIMEALNLSLTHSFVLKIADDKQLSIQEMRVLMFLSRIIEINDSVNQQCLSKLMGIDRTTVTKIIDLLESKKVVKREVNHQNRRENLLRITQKGQTTINEIRINLDESLDYFMDDTTEEEKKYLESILLKITKKIEEKNERNI